MLDIKKLRENPESLLNMLRKRRFEHPFKGTMDSHGKEMDVDEFFFLDKEIRASLREIEELRTRRKQIAEEYPKLKKSGKSTEELSKETERLKEILPSKEKEYDENERRLKDALLRLPNFLHDSVPEGGGAEENVLVRSWGKIPEFTFETRTHWEIGESLGVLDFGMASKISGSGFAVLRGAGAALERSLISLMLDLHIREHGYTEVFAPYLVHAVSMEGTGQLPKFEEEVYRIEKDGLYLIPTAEVSVTNLHRDDTFVESDLPKKYVSYSACFRREAGSYGKDTKGLIRNHQFNKVELVWFTTPKSSFESLEKLTEHAENVLKVLGIPYRIMCLCGGDTGFASAKTYDLEVWMPGEKRWREISSCSCFTDFQSRRMNIKYRDSQGKKELVHTLNGSGTAVGRLFAAVLENYQAQDGSVTVPEALRPYLKMERINP